jgi:hypothetical protein
LAGVRARKKYLSFFAKYYLQKTTSPIYYIRQQQQTTLTGETKMKNKAQKITNTFERNGKVLLSTTCELSLRGRYLGDIRGVQCFASVRFRDPNDRRCGVDYSVAGFGGSYSVIQRDESGKILSVVAVTTVDTLRLMPGAALAY